MRTHKPPAFHKQSTRSQELPVLTDLLFPTNPTAPASRTVGEGVTGKAFLKLSGKAHLLGMKVTLVLMSSGTALGVPMSPFPTLRLHIAGAGEGNKNCKHSSSFLFIPTKLSGWTKAIFSLFLPVSSRSLPDKPWSSPPRSTFSFIKEKDVGSEKSLLWLNHFCTSIFLKHVENQILTL